MGARPSVPTDAQVDELKRRMPELSARAACAIEKADILIVATGAGWSADSGLARTGMWRTCKRTTTVASPTGAFACRTGSRRTRRFFTALGGCYNDYRNVQPHEGYAIVKRWVERGFPYTAAAAEIRKFLVDRRAMPIGDEPAVPSQPSVTSEAGAFFSYSSNVDAHWHTAGFGAFEVHEIHGNCESVRATPNAPRTGTHTHTHTSKPCPPVCAVAVCGSLHRPPLRRAVATASPSTRRRASPSQGSRSWLRALPSARGSRRTRSPCRQPTALRGVRRPGAACGPDVW